MQGWILANRSVGAGFYRQQEGIMTLDVLSYTVATATTGTVFFAMLAALGVTPARNNVDAAFKHLARADDDQTTALEAVSWLLHTIAPNGDIPGWLDNAVEVSQSSSSPFPPSNSTIVSLPLF